MSEANSGLVVLGGGVAGLAAAMATDAPLYEAGDEIGGLSRSKTIDGFTFDYGIHILQTQHAVVQGLFRECQIALGTHERNAHIYSHETYTAYPFQVNTAGLPLGLRARCLWHYFRRNSSGKPTNYEEWILQSIGKAFGDTFLIPYSEKFWTVHPREMTHEWTGGRVPQVSASQVLRGAFINRQTKVGSNVVFEYPDHGEGYGAIPTRMGRRVNRIHLKHRATRIDASRRRILFNDGRAEISYRTLISTIPLPELMAIIPEAPDRVREAASKLRCNSIIVVNLGIGQPNISDRHWVHFPEKDICFFRISYPHNLGPGLVPPGMSSVTAEVAYSKDRPVDKSTVVDRVIEDLRRVGAIRRDDPIVLRDTMDIKYGYVIYDHERRAALQIIRKWLSSMDICSTGRYGLWAYLWSHEAILAGKQIGEKLAFRAASSAVDLGEIGERA